MATTKKQTALYFQQDTWALLRQLAFDQHTSISKLVEELVNEALAVRATAQQTPG